ncbi:MAG: hypothetical protein AAFR51_17965 [Pseudomonadota bacterium]
MSTSAQMEATSEALVDSDIFDEDEPNVALEGEPESEAEVVPPGFLAKVIRGAKSPIGLGASAVVVISMVGAILFVSGVFQTSNGAEDNEAIATVETPSSELQEASASPVAEYGEEDLASAAETDAYKEETPAGPLYGDISFAASGAMYHTAPTTVALKIGGESAYLTLSLGILSDKAGVEQLMAQGLAVNILKIEAAQSVNYGRYLEWELPGLISKEVKTRLEESFPGTTIQGVLIRDFQLTV